MPEPTEAQVVEKTETTDSPQGKVEGEQATATQSNEVENKTDEKETTPATEEKEKGSIPEVDMEGVEVTDNGKVKITLGNSVYIGDNFNDAWKKARESETEKDKAFKERDLELKKLKTQSHIRVPDDDEAEAKLPPQPIIGSYVKEVFTEQGLKPEMAMWGDDDQRWDDLQEKEGLKDWRISQLINKAKEARVEANRRYDADLTQYINKTTLVKDLTPAVEEMVVESGLEPEDVGAHYHGLLKTPEMYFKDGSLNTSKILTAMSKKIMTTLKEHKTSDTELSKKKKALEAELEQKKKTLTTSSARTTQKQENHDKPAMSIREAMERIRSGR